MKFYATNYKYGEPYAVWVSAWPSVTADFNFSGLKSGDFEIPRFETGATERALRLLYLATPKIDIL